ncbi:DMT family transporter [Egibacter rhizosphaerae]|uniref:DMT family transporter n=1 Tax=Egibacter rhizosphaerae TaxID=1670831 RepID=UPI0013F1730B|nr:EamA family transporter [Egibacter rhizosphaerae]
MLAAAVLWGTAGTTASLEDIAPPAAQAAAWRGVLGAAALLLATVAAGQLRALTAMMRGPRRSWLVCAAVAVALFQVAFFTAVHLTGVALGTVVALGSAPIVGGIVRALTTGRPPSPRWAFATTLAVAGVALLLLPTGERAADPLGIALAAVAGAAFAGYTLVLQRHRALGDRLLPTTAAAFGGSAVLLSPLIAFGDHGWLESPAGVGVALWLGLVTAGLAYALYAAGLRTVPAPRALTMTLAEPVTAVLLGLLLLGEPLTPTGLAGLLLVSGGLAAAVRPPSRWRTSDPPPPQGSEPVSPASRSPEPRGGERG